MTGPDREAQRDAVVNAACRWAGATVATVDRYRRNPAITDGEVAGPEAWLRDTLGQDLLAAVNTYLDGYLDGIHARAGGER